MSWQTDVSVWVDKPDSIQVFSDDGREQDYVPERTCRNVHEPPKGTTFWPSPHFKCSECGAVHVSMDYVNYCPNCGAKVVSE